MSFCDILQTNRLCGSSLTSPLTHYHTFFSETRAQSQGWKYVALTISHFITGLILYPLFGLLALIGMIPKSIDAAIIKSDNDAAFLKFLNDKERGGFEKKEREAGVKSPAGEQPQQSFTLAWATPNGKIKEHVDHCSNMFRRCYFSFTAHQLITISTL